MKYLVTVILSTLLYNYLSVNGHQQRQTFWSSNSFKKNGLLESSTSGIKRVAIIGAGAGGTSAAYFLNKSQREYFPGLEIEIDVFEKSEHIGGRVESKIIGLDEEKYDLGANAFVDVNYNLMNASKEFNINYENNGNSSNALGLYNGAKFVSRMGKTFKEKVSFYYRYAWGLFRASRFATQVKNEFLKLYDETLPPYESVEEMLDRVKLTEYLYRTTQDVLVNDWYVGSTFSNEMFPAISRNIYAIDGGLHSLAGAIALIAVGGSYTSSDGNILFFKGYMEHSNANLFLKSPVTEIKKISDLEKTSYSIKVNDVKVDKHYDVVIMANPYHQSGIQLNNINTEIPKIEYKHVHVAIVEDALINPSYFNLSRNDDVPETIFGFNASFPYTVINHSPETRRISVEGTQPITLDSLTPLLMETPHYDKITIKNWQAYPVMKVFDKSIPLRNQFPPIRIAPSLYYVNAVEPAISCMEVEIMSARNIVRMVLNDIKST